MSENGRPHVGSTTSSESCLFHGSQSTISGGAEINSSAGDHNRLLNIVNICNCQGMRMNPGNSSTLAGNQNPLALSRSDSGQGPLAASPINRAILGPHSGFRLDDTLDTSTDRILTRTDQGTQTDPGNESVWRPMSYFGSSSGSQNSLVPSADSGQGPSTASPLTPGTQPCSVTPSAEEGDPPNSRYERHLLVKKHGFPLWAPQPHSRLPLSYRRKGVSVGDVGIITRQGYFDFLFNICLPRGHASNPEFLPIDFSPVELSPSDISELHEHDPGSCLLTSTTAKLRGFNFKCNGPEGSILVMPNGAYHEDLLNMHKFQRIASQNAENWYRFAIGTCGRAIGNGELRLVTGCDKTNSWGIATYSDFPPGTLTLAANGVQPPTVYTWDYEGCVEAKAGPKLNDLLLLATADSEENPWDIRNQCTFLRAHTVSLAKDVWETMVSTLVPDSSGNHISNSPEPQSYFTSIVSGSIFGFGNGGRSVNVRNHSLESVNFTTHPSTLINEMLLSEYPNAKVAISHDDDWCAVIREDEIIMPDASELLVRIRQTFTFHFDEDGTVCLSQEHAPEANPQRESPSQDGLVTVPGNSKPAQETLSNATNDTHNEDGKLPQAARARGKQPIWAPITVFSAESTPVTEVPVTSMAPCHLPAHMFDPCGIAHHDPRGNPELTPSSLLKSDPVIMQPPTRNPDYFSVAPSSVLDDNLTRNDVDAINELSNKCQRHLLLPPEYRVNQSGLPDGIWTARVTIDNVTCVMGYALTEENSKEAAARSALEYLNRPGVLGPEPRFKGEDQENQDTLSMTS